VATVPSTTPLQHTPKTIEGKWIGTMNKTLDISPDRRYSGTSNYMVKVSSGDTLEGFYSGSFTGEVMSLGIDGRNGHFTYSAERDVISYDGQEFRRAGDK
jgi:hypothetical protein